MIDSGAAWGRLLLPARYAPSFTIRNLSYVRRQFGRLARPNAAGEPACQAVRGAMHPAVKAMRVLLPSLLIGAAIGCSSTTAHPVGESPAAGAALPTLASVHDTDFPLGCYRADRILGHAARAESGLASHGFDTFQLLADGRVARPRLLTASSQEMWARAGFWQLRADTLEVRLSTGLVGWALRLELQQSGSADTSLVGMARYLTDVAVRDTTGWHTHPLRFPVRVAREGCSRPS